MNTPISSMLWVASGSFIGSFGSVFLKLGSAKLGGGIKSVLINWRLIVGIAFYLFSSVFYLKGVQHGQLSVLYPMVSLGSVFTMLWSRVFLQEALTPTKLGALALIVIGIVLVGVGS